MRKTTLAAKTISNQSEVSKLEESKEMFSSHIVVLYIKLYHWQRVLTLCIVCQSCLVDAKSKSCTDIHRYRLKSSVSHVPVMRDLINSLLTRKSIYLIGRANTGTHYWPVAIRWFVKQIAHNNSSIILLHSVSSHLSIVFLSYFLYETSRK